MDDEKQLTLSLDLSTRSIYTIGSSNRDLGEFVGLLLKHQVQTLIDVRRYPDRTSFEHFSKEHLSEKLEHTGVQYVWLGERLGGFRDGGYEQYLHAAEFQDGLAELERIGTGRIVAYVCAERHPSACHRRFISRALSQRGWNVVDIV